MVIKKRQRAISQQLELMLRTPPRVDDWETPHAPPTISPAQRFDRAAYTGVRRECARERLLIVVAALSVILGAPLLVIGAECLRVDVKPVLDIFGLALATIAPILAISAAYYFRRGER